MSNCINRITLVKQNQYIFTRRKCLCSSGNLDCFNEMEILFSCKFTAMMTPERKERRIKFQSLSVAKEARNYLKDYSY